MSSSWGSILVYRVKVGHMFCRSWVCLVGALLLASVCFCVPFGSLDYRWVLWHLHACLCWILENLIFVPISFSAQDPGYPGLWISFTPEILLIHIPLHYVSSKKCCRHGHLSALLGGRARGLRKQHNDLWESLRQWEETEGKLFEADFYKFVNIQKPSHGWIQGPAPSRIAVWLQASPLISLGLIFPVCRW